MKPLGLSSLLSALLVCTAAAGGATITVGPSGPPTYQYSRINQAVVAASDGDTITIDSGYYSHGGSGVDPASPGTTSSVEPMAFINKSLTIIGNAANPPVMDAMGYALRGEGCWIIQSGASSVVIQNVVFENARASTAAGLNGACIRVESCAGSLTLNSCVFMDSQNGVLDTNSSACNLTIQNCVIHDCGDPVSSQGGGVTHNLYLQGNRGVGNTLIFKYNWSYNCHAGSCLKSCYANNYIMYNRMGDEMGLALDATPHSPVFPSGNVVDVPNGGLTYLMGNVLQNVPGSQNSNMVSYGEYGITAGYSSQLYAVYNTILCRRAARTTALFASNCWSGTCPDIANNFFVCDTIDGQLVNVPGGYWDWPPPQVALYDGQGRTPPAVHRYMYDANGYDGDGNTGTPGTYVNWDVLNVEPIDPNHITFPHAGVTYQTLIGLALPPGTGFWKLPATGIDGTSLIPSSVYGPMPFCDCMPLGQTRSLSGDVGAYPYLWMPFGHPSIQSFTCPNDYIYEGWTVTLTATANDVNASQALTAAFSQTAGQTMTLGSPSTPSSPLPVTWTFPVSLPLRSLTSVANGTLTFSLTATDMVWLTTPPATVTIQAYMAGDVDHDNAVNLADLKLLVGAWNSAPASGNWNPAADLDNSGGINLADLKLLIANWSRSLG